MRLDKACTFGDDTKRSRTGLLEDRLRDLERELHVVETGLFKTSILSHALWNIRPSHRRPSTLVARTQTDSPLFMAFYCHAPSQPLTVQSHPELRDPHAGVIPQATIETALRSWDTTTEVPPNLRDYLYVSYIIHMESVNCSTGYPAFGSSYPFDTRQISIYTFPPF